MLTETKDNVWNSLPDHVVDVNSHKQFETTKRFSCIKSWIIHNQTVADHILQADR